MPEIEIRPLRDDELDWAAERYREIKFAASPPGTLGLVAELEAARVGLGRLVEHEPGVIELGGIWTDPAARNRGIARSMVTALIERAGPVRLWCIPFAHLAAFYESAGFTAARRPWPGPIAAKVAACESQRLPTVVVLARAPIASSAPAPHKRSA
jgi:GNAT superfamily N-acetyltransferase